MAFSPATKKNHVPMDASTLTPATPAPNQVENAGIVCVCLIQQQEKIVIIVLLSCPNVDV